MVNFIVNMKYISIEILRNKRKLTDKCYVAECFFSRLKGLIGKKELKIGEGMLFPRCNSVHTFFMSLSIDIVFLSKSQDKDGYYKVSSIRSRVKPWKAFLLDFKSTDVLELPLGTVDRCELMFGDEVCIS